MRGAAVQIDAELNYGNAGGAVVDLDGKLLGIACNITERAQWGQNSGVGFAVTWDRVEDLLPRLQDGLKSAVPPRPYIGVRPAEGALDVKGAAIDEVIPGGPAAAAGLRDGDLILRIDDQTIRNWGDLVRAIRKRKVGDEVRITVDRLGEKKVFRVTIGQLDHE
jgi:S1-C subfamily serine protease